MEQTPAAFVYDLREALFHQWSFGQAADRIGQRSLADPLQGIPDPQAQLLHIEWLGDVIICTDFESLQTVGTLTLFGQEDNRDFVVRRSLRTRRATSNPSISGRRISRIIRSGMTVWAARTPSSPQLTVNTFIALDAEIGIQHFRDIQVILND